MDIVAQRKNKGLKGEIVIPSDKSISHRAAMFALLAGGKLFISNFSQGADCRSTLQIINSLGAEIKFVEEKTVFIDSSKGILFPMYNLNCGNSGTTMRLMSGILAGQNFQSELFGDESLSKRPMKRVIEPLSLMGAQFEHNDFKAPLRIFPSKLKGIEYHSPIASAQVKSALLLAGLFADGTTTVVEPYKSRNHTELMLEYLGADIEVLENRVSIRKSQLAPKDIEVCGDISSAAFFMVAALIVEGSDITLKNVGINPTRSGIIDVLKKMGADIEFLNEREVSGEPVCDLRVKYSNLKSTTVEGAIIPRLIDEIPVLVVAATQAEGTTVIKDANDLRNKEADRIKVMVCELKRLGAELEETDDGFIIYGKTKLKGGSEHQCYHDHRVAMSLYVAGLICEKPVKIKEFQWVDISFPEFLGLMGQI